MRYFALPDLGEGLQEAEIVEWYVNEGDRVAVDQPLVAVETDKAIVDVPSPQAGVIGQRFASPGDSVNVGEPLVEFADAEQEAQEVRKEQSSSATVVGQLPQAQEASQDQFIIGGSQQAAAPVRATPSVRALAKRLNVDLQTISGSGDGGRITAEDIERANRMNTSHGPSEQLSGVRKSMAKNMARAHAAVVPVTLFDEADVTEWQPGEDISVRLLQAIAAACQAEPQLNAWFDDQQLRLLSNIDVGMAVDTEQGLFVPVLRDVANRSADDLRNGLANLREDVKQRSIPPHELKGATITLSNYGSLARTGQGAGIYGTPIVVPPTVAIVGAGRIQEKAMVHMGELFAGKALPLSLTFDHRVVTGGEASRFLGALIKDLQREPSVVDH
ncbi:branched-chain alpha-keto acid dehydrogenase subunit E2 [Bacterioplanes sanyensis]|uniref:Dihydrolipoamide acetyltransferase component of pyruvate dehydrogenase complex n=1 Tax=Bacterioplanes sanyensis TaxID=1249553 RepID=A0A222FK02_9GAMM|nr:dihydrolipoamide acetyltransferase family protein [Bacterioplanes sanyensis]ASP39367.1 branched-chain alpha-keto acid dehydrogenase subunit E2 [Bacterioplanes sanyensis]